jgi:mannose-1-phosphate guanylyltransferase
MRYAMIMAGGAGTRLWPLSRQGRPKQLLRFIRRSGDERARSLLELSAGRLEGLIPVGQRYICTAEAYRTAIRADLPEFTDEQILGEPVGRDTVNAVGFAAAVLHRQDPDAVFTVLTADHIIEPVEEFQRLIDLGFRLVEADGTRLVTFSIKPTYPATGFGYVERGAPISGVDGADGLAFRVSRFVEKPDLPRAQAYVESGYFGWNSGMFVWKAATVLECLERFKPESHAGLMRIAEAWGTADQGRVLAEVYPTLPKTSIDYAVMEPASRDRAVSVCTVQMDVSWLDVGSWPSYAQTLEADAEGNRTSLLAEDARTVSVAGKNNLVVNAAARHTVAVLGVEGLIVVHTPDATLVMPAARAEDLKSLHAKVEPGLH